MRIVHFSDWHGETFPLPAADLYVCTGDMLPNFRTYVFQSKDRAPVEWVHNMELVSTAPPPRPRQAFLHKLPPVHANEALLQCRYMKRIRHGCIRKRMASPDAPVVCCRGNHDFTDIAPLFAGGPVHEISDDPTQRYVLRKGGRRLVVGGMRGVKTRSGKWADAMTDAEFAERAMHLPLEIDVLVTHAPPHGILDFAYGEATGYPALREYSARREAAWSHAKLHLFGHIHESQGVQVQGSTLFSNASCGVQVIEI